MKYNAYGVPRITGNKNISEIPSKTCDKSKVFARKSITIQKTDEKKALFKQIRSIFLKMNK